MCVFFGAFETCSLQKSGGRSQAKYPLWPRKNLSRLQHKCFDSESQKFCVFSVGLLARYFPSRLVVEDQREQGMISLQDSPEGHRLVGSKLAIGTGLGLFELKSAPIADTSLTFPTPQSCPAKNKFLWSE